MDTNVVVIALSFSHLLDIDELWIEFGVGKNRRGCHFTSIHLASEDVCAMVCVFSSLSQVVIHAVSAFCGKGKKTCWNARKSFHEITETFSRY